MGLPPPTNQTNAAWRTTCEMQNVGLALSSGGPHGCLLCIRHARTPPHAGMQHATMLPGRAARGQLSKLNAQPLCGNSPCPLAVYQSLPCAAHTLLYQLHTGTMQANLNHKVNEDGSPMHSGIGSEQRTQRRHCADATPTCCSTGGARACPLHHHLCKHTRQHDHSHYWR
jgi:hypothetical protein